MREGELERKRGATRLVEGLGSLPQWTLLGLSSETVIERAIRLILYCVDW